MLLYVIPVIAASFVLNPAGAFVFAALSTIGYALAYQTSQRSDRRL